MLYLTSNKQIKWSDIKEIEFKNYAIEFLFNNLKSQLIILRTNAETSIEIKKLVREIATQKSINIVGG